MPNIVELTQSLDVVERFKFKISITKEHNIINYVCKYANAMSVHFNSKQ